MFSDLLDTLFTTVKGNVKNYDVIYVAILYLVIYLFHIQICILY